MKTARVYVFICGSCFSFSFTHSIFSESANVRDGSTHYDTENLGKEIYSFLIFQGTVTTYMVVIPMKLATNKTG